ncbi:winged helix-turn-helix transcriptional regulator [Dorea formicigenerans]|nr:winged helix-turn-helix transcriptional regulator [Dorea formicigenerans]
MDIIERDIYALIASGDGIKAREIAKKLNKDRSTVNHYLYNSPYMKDLCYRNENYEWYGLIRQSRPHVGLGDYSGYYGTVAEFLELTEDEWFQMLTEGCRKIGRILTIQEDYSIHFGILMR